MRMWSRVVSKIHAKRLFQSQTLHTACTRLCSTSSSVLDLSGIFPPVVTAFKHDETICFDKFAQNFSQWNKIPFKGYLVQGSNGEYGFLSTEERIEMVQRVRLYIPKGRLLLVGSGCPTTRLTIQMTKEMANAGADAAVVVTPSFFKGQMNNFALETYYSQVANESPIPIVLYNVPAMTGIDMSAELINSLATHKNIIGLKDSGGDVVKLAQIVAKTRSIGFQVLAGSASFLVQAYSIGCVGGIVALANVLGPEVCELHSAFFNGDYEKAKQLQLSLVEPNLAVTKKYGVPGLKAAMDWKGYYGGPVRSPLQPIETNDSKKLENILRPWLVPASAAI